METKFKRHDMVIGNSKANHYDITKQGWVGIVLDVNPKTGHFIAEDIHTAAFYGMLDPDCFEHCASKEATAPTAKKDNRKDCKPPLKYLHPEFMTGTAYGMLAGELKYSAWNFVLGHDRQDLIDGAIRHLLAARAGEHIDADTTARLEAVFGDKAPQVKHLWLAACNINMLLWQEVYGTARDSWPKGEKV